MAEGAPQQQPNILPPRRVARALQQLLTDDLVLVWGVVLTAWALILLSTVTGFEHHLHHTAMMEHSTSPWPLKLLLFLSAWQVMTGAMMLPSSLPMVRLFAQASSGQAHPRLVLLTFLAAYATVWSGFALLTFVGDLGLHWLFSYWPWLHTRPELLSGLTLLVAGAFQFSPLKESCMKQCQNPMSFLMQHYQRGLRSAWNLGSRHGLYCLGCCWALMLVMFAVGMANLAWMLALTGVMVLEKTSQHRQWLVPVVGVVLLIWGVIVLLQPGWVL